MLTRRVVSSRVRGSVLTFSLRAALPGTLLLAGSVMTSSSAAQRPSSGDQQPPTFRTEVNQVEVDVTVTDSRGNFVRDLAPDDFVVLEDGKPQEVTTFALVDLPYEVRSPVPSLPATRIEADIRSNAAEADGRVFVMVLDDLHTHPLRSARVKEAAREFIERHVSANDLVSIVHTSGRSAATQEFTPRASLLLASVDKFLGRKLRSGVLERLDAHDRERNRDTRADIRMQHVFDPLDLERAQQAQDMLETLEGLGDLLADARGRRKAVVLISEGIDYDIGNGIAQTASGLSTFTASAAPTVMARLRDAIGAMARANVTVYGIDPRGLATAGDDLIEAGSFPENPLLGLNPTAFQDEVQQSQDSLRVLSEETGGFASVSSNDLSEAFERIIRDNSTYYLLGYRSNNARADGRFRKIDVRVNRPNLQVRARKGYVAPSRDAAGVKADAAPSAQLQMVLNHPLPVSAVPLRAFAAPFKGAGSTGSVLFGLEVDARNFTFGRKDGLYTNQIEAAVVAIDAQGKFLEGGRHAVALRLKPETYSVVRANGLRLLFRLHLPPGQYQLRAALHEAGSGALGSVHYDLEVGDFTGSALSMSGVVLTSTGAAATPTPRPDPDLQGLVRYPPTGSRKFTTAETLEAVFVLYKSPKEPVGPVAIATTLTDKDGRVRFNSEMEVSDDELREATNGYGYIVPIPLAGMPPGTYVLRVQAKSRRAEGLTAVRELPFQVGSAESTAARQER